MEILLWEQRNRQKYTLAQLSELTGISKSEINAIENGIVSPRLDTLERLAAGLKVNITDLYYSSITESGN